MTREEAIYRLRVMQAANDGSFEDSVKEGLKADEPYAPGETMTFREFFKADHEAYDMAIKALEAEPCEDCISRQAAIQAVTHFDDTLKRLYELPSAEPERKSGKWVHMVGWWECDQCNAEYTGMPTCMGKVIYEYCPMCGSYNGGGNNGNE